MDNSGDTILNYIAKATILAPKSLIFFRVKSLEVTTVTFLKNIS